MVITMSKFSKNFRGSMPPDPLKAVFISQLASNEFCQKKKKKKTLKKCQTLVFPP